MAFAGNIQDFGNVCVIEDDGTLVTIVGGNPAVDFVAAYQAFRTHHDDVYDFVTFVTDSDHGMPPQGGASWYQFVFNDISGIGLGLFNNRPAFGSSMLQGIIFLNQGHFSAFRYVMLQEQEHRWAAFARYRDAAAGPLMNDHLLGGWGHWEYGLDDDRSPMDYDVYDWQETLTGFNQITLTSDQRSFCHLDLYLMGLLEPEKVGDIYLLSNIQLVGGNSYTANKKRLTLQNFILAEGPRVPAAAISPKLFKHAFVVLTGDITRVHDLAERVDDLRRRFEQDFYEATKRLGRVDTSLGALHREVPFVVEALTVNPAASPTTSSSVTLTGAKPAGTAVRVRGVEAVPLNSTTAWSATVSLDLGGNIIPVTAADGLGNMSPPVTVNIDRQMYVRLSGDTMTGALQLDNADGVGGLRFRKGATGLPEWGIKTHNEDLIFIEPDDGNREVVRFLDISGPASLALRLGGLANASLSPNMLANMTSAAVSRWIRADDGTTLETVNLGSARSVVALIAMASTDPRHDHDRGDMFGADIFRVDGQVNRGPGWWFGGDHLGADGADTNLFSPVFIGTASSFQFRLRSFQDASVWALCLVFAQP